MNTRRTSAKKRPPYARQFHVTGIQIACLFVGEPVCWEHARREQGAGFFNHLVLPEINDTGLYDWSLLNAQAVIVIDFNDAPSDPMMTLVKALFNHGALSVAVVNFNDPQQNVVSFNRSAAPGER